MAEIIESNGVSDEEMEIVDLDGEPFVIVDEMQYEGVNYLALVKYTEEDEAEEDEETEFIILKEAEENGEYFLATIDDDELYEKIGSMFLAEFDGD